MPGPSALPSISPSKDAVFQRPREPIHFSSADAVTSDSWSGVDAEVALMAIVSSQNIQEATGLDRQGLLRRFSHKWTADSALRDCKVFLPTFYLRDPDIFLLNPAVERSALESVRGDGISPLLKISPALMHIENISLQSLARSTRGVGVTDLREALEGRSSMSNPALVRPPSISTLDHTSVMGGDVTSGKLAQTRSRTKKRAAATGPGEVRDVLHRLGIGKQNGGSLLKASFPSLQKADHR